MLPFVMTIPDYHRLLELQAKTSNVAWLRLAASKAAQAWRG